MFFNETLAFSSCSLFIFSRFLQVLSLFARAILSRHVVFRTVQIFQPRVFLLTPALSFTLWSLRKPFLNHAVGAYFYPRPCYIRLLFFVPSKNETSPQFSFPFPSLNFCLSGSFLCNAVLFSLYPFPRFPDLGKFPDSWSRNTVFPRSTV